MLSGCMRRHSTVTAKVIGSGNMSPGAEASFYGIAEVRTLACCRLVQAFLL